MAALIQQVDWSSVNMATRRQIRDHEPVAKNYLKSADKRVPKILPRLDGERFSGTPSQHCFRRPPSDVDCIAKPLLCVAKLSME